MTRHPFEGGVVFLERCSLSGVIYVLQRNRELPILIY